LENENEDGTKKQSNKRAMKIDKNGREDKIHQLESENLKFPSISFHFTFSKMELRNITLIL